MQLDLDVTGHRILVVGRWPDSRRAVRRYLAAGARVTAVVDGAVPPTDERPSTVRFVELPAPRDTSGLLRLLGPAWLLVSVGLPLPRPVGQLAARLKLPVTTEPAARREGSVTLVGGGPGTGQLLTVAALEALRDSDVVFYDRLAPAAELRRLAPQADLVDVGKTPYHHRTPQTRIQELMISRAAAGATVVRLKGGDPFVLGRGAEELQACVAADVAVRVVPGVSSAISVPAAAGIPVTSRGHSRCFTVLSGHIPPSDTELGGLVATGGTIVVLMGMANLTQICAGLVRSGMPAGTPAAVVERGFTDSQRTTLSTVAGLPGQARRLDVTSPAVVVIGDVAAFAAHGTDPDRSLLGAPEALARARPR